MTLVYDYDIPAGLLDIVTELGVVLEGVYRNDGLVIVNGFLLAGILVRILSTP